MIPVKGERARSVELKYTRHGPVVFEDRGVRVARARQQSAESRRVGIGGRFGVGQRRRAEVT